MVSKTLVESHIIPQLNKSVRLQEYGVGIFKTVSTKSALKKALKKELIFVNGTIASTGLYIKGNETIELYQLKELPDSLKKLKLPLKIHFEDDYLAVIEKSAGVLVSGNSFVSIYNALPQNLQASNLEDAVRPAPIHRLDYPTSGLLLIGKTNSTVIALSKLFEHKRIKKTYHAISIGEMKQNGEITLPIDNKESLTKYEVLHTATSKRFDFLNLVKLHPKTGRKHQLRKHLASIKNPVLGDKDYFIENLILTGKGLYLHASKLEFIHPFTKEDISITSKLPKKFKKIFPYL